MWFDCVERKRRAGLPTSVSAPRAFAATLSFQAYLRACICTFCMCVCIYLYMCMCADMYIYIYMCTCVCICICMRLDTCVCVCVRIFLHRLWVSVSVLQRLDGVMHRTGSDDQISASRSSISMLDPAISISNH